MSLAGAAPSIVAAPIWSGLEGVRGGAGSPGGATARRGGALKGFQGAIPAQIQQMRAREEFAPARGGWQDLSAADGDARVHQIPPSMDEVPSATTRETTTSGSEPGHYAPRRFVASRPFEGHTETSGSPHQGHRPVPPTRFYPSPHSRVPASAAVDAEQDCVSGCEHSEESAIGRAAALVAEATKHHEAREVAMERNQERTRAFADSIRTDINAFYPTPVPANPADHAMAGMRRTVGEEQKKVGTCRLPPRTRSQGKKPKNFPSQNPLCKLVVPAVCAPRADVTHAARNCTHADMKNSLCTPSPPCSWTARSTTF